MIIHNGQTTPFLAVVQVVRHKVHAPALVLPGGGYPDLPELRADPSLGYLFPHLKPFFLVNPVHSLGVDRKAFSPNKNGYSSIPISGLF
jgi:hypothetical protein